MTVFPLECVRAERRERDVAMVAYSPVCFLTGSQATTTIRCPREDLQAYPSPELGFSSGFVTSGRDVGLLNRCRGNSLPWVRIPPLPPAQNPDKLRVLLLLLARYSLQTAAPVDRHAVALQTAVPVWTRSNLAHPSFTAQRSGAPLSNQSPLPPSHALDGIRTSRPLARSRSSSHERTGARRIAS